MLTVFKTLKVMEDSAMEEVQLRKRENSMVEGFM